MGGSGGGSGGGGASPPAYLQNLHADWLAKFAYGVAGVLADKSMTEIINEALDPVNNPFYQREVFDPSPYLNSMYEAIQEFGNTARLIYSTFDVDRPDIDVGWIVRTTEAVQREQFNAETIPSFERGMADVGASNGSAFVVGRAIIETSMRRSMDFVGADVAYKTEFAKYQTAVELCFKDKAWEQEWRTRNVQYFLDYWKHCIVSGVDKSNQQIAWWEAEKRWPLDVYQHGANLLAAVSGGTVPTPSRQISTTASTIGNSLSGSYAGWQIGKEVGGNTGGGWGAAIGGIIGGISGYLSSR